MLDCDWSSDVCSSDLRARAGAAKERLDASIAQFDEMKSKKAQFIELKRRAPTGKQEEVIDPAKIAMFISSTANSKGLPNPSISQSQQPKQGVWTEHATLVNLRGSRDSAIARGPLIDFLSTVERERSYLKSKELSMTFAKESPDLSSARAVISYFRRD
jgi:hypothetical protein